ISLGPNLATGKIGAHGVSFPVEEEYEMMKSINGVYYDEGEERTIKHGLPRIDTGKRASEAVLTLSSATNGKVSQRAFGVEEEATGVEDRKSTRLNSSHVLISYAVFCLKKNKNYRK